jgi:hypothetical protein
MIVGGVEKQPNEAFVIGISFAARLGVGETLATPTVTAKDATSGADTSGTVLSGSPSAASGVVTQKVHQGASGTRHIVQFRVTTSAGNTLEDELSLTIHEH